MIKINLVNKKINWLLLGALAGSVLTYAILTTQFEFANAVVESERATTEAKFKTCVMKVAPLMSKETKAAEWCAEPANRDGLWPWKMDEKSLPK